MIKTRPGIHCETCATGNLLINIGINLSENMLFGLGEGLGFGVINFGKMPFPFLGGRIKQGLITENICRNLNLNLTELRTTSKKKAWTNVKEKLDLGIPVGLQLDSYYLDYFKVKVHFAGHYAAITHYDDNYAYLVDTSQQGGEMKTSLSSLEEARNAKGPMSDKNKSYTITKNGEYDIKEVIKTAIRNNANDFLNPPIKNFGYKGIIKASEELKKWLEKSSNPKEDFSLMAMLMEKAGTGGSIFRNIYAGFLEESYEFVKDEKISIAHEMFKESSKLWSKVISIFNKVSTSDDKAVLVEASKILLKICDLEFKAMSELKDI